MRKMTVVFATLALAACGGTDRGATSDSAAGDVTKSAAVGEFVVGLNEWTVDLPMDTLPAGRYTFRVENTGRVKHALEFEGNGREWKTDELEPGAKTDLTLDLEPGTYEVYCPVESGDAEHDERGMKRMLVVRAG